MTIISKFDFSHFIYHLDPESIIQFLSPFILKFISMKKIVIVQKQNK